MKKTKSMVVPLLVLCAALLFITGCGAKKTVQAGTPGAPDVPDTPLHKLNSAVYDISAGLSAGERELEIVSDAGLIDTEEAAVAGKAINDANECNRAFDARLKTQNAVNSGNKQKVLAWSQDLTACLNSAVNDNVLGFKNPTAKQKVKDAFALVNIAISQIAGALLQVPDAPSPRITLPMPTQQTKNLANADTKERGEKLYGVGHDEVDHLHATDAADRRRNGDSTQYSGSGEGGDTARGENSAGGESTAIRTARRRDAFGRGSAVAGGEDRRGYGLQAERISAAAPGEVRREARELRFFT